MQFMANSKPMCQIRLEFSDGKCILMHLWPRKINGSRFWKILVLVIGMLYLEWKLPFSARWVDQTLGFQRLQWNLLTILEPALRYVFQIERHVLWQPNVHSWKKRDSRTSIRLLPNHSHSQSTVTDAFSLTNTSYTSKLIEHIIWTM